MSGTVERVLAYHNLMSLLSNEQQRNKDVTRDDKTFRNKTTKQISDRDEKYTELLEHFIKITKIRNVLKEVFKWVFYMVIMFSVIMLTCLVYRIFDRILMERDLNILNEMIPLLITSMISFASTIIAIPLAIAKYLFSTKEDENITQIILHTQEHDTSGRRWAMEFNKEKNISNKRCV